MQREKRGLEAWKLAAECRRVGHQMHRGASREDAVRMASAARNLFSAARPAAAYPSK